MLFRSPRVHYVLGGAGPDSHRVEAMIRDLRLERSVTLAGFIPDDELCDFYNLCDVYAMPSKAEGFGIVFLEALSCGKAVVAGNRDGSVDAVLDGEIGCLVDPDNVEEIGGAMASILAGTHPLETLRRPEVLRRRVIEAYGFERYVGVVRSHLEALGVKTGTDRRSGASQLP